jgi:hypothetical protein
VRLFHAEQVADGEEYEEFHDPPFCDSVWFRTVTGYRLQARRTPVRAAWEAVLGVSWGL